MVLSNLEPKSVFRFFEELCRIPHGSGNTAVASAWAEAFARELAGVEFQKPSAVLYSDLTAEPYGGDAASLLSRQICSPVQWERLIRGMIAAGVDTFLEVGPGKTLTNMIRKIDGSAKAQNYMEYLAEVQQC